MLRRIEVLERLYKDRNLPVLTLDLAVSVDFSIRFFRLWSWPIGRLITRPCFMAAIRSRCRWWRSLRRLWRREWGLGNRWGPLGLDFALDVCYTYMVVIRWFFVVFIGGMGMRLRRRMRNLAAMPTRGVEVAEDGRLRLPKPVVRLLGDRDGFSRSRNGLSRAVSVAELRVYESFRAQLEEPPASAAYATDQRVLVFAPYGRGEKLRMSSL